MNEVVTNNMKQIQDIIDECRASIETKQQKIKDVKEAVKILNRAIDNFKSNDVLAVDLLGIIGHLSDTANNMEDLSDIEASIATDKEKIKKYNKALLALQEIDN